MEVRLLGPLELLVEGRPIRLEASKQRTLLALLALHANEVVAADRAVDELWGERPPASAHKLVQTYVWQLRKLIGGALRTRPPGYELTLPAEQTDSGCFERLLERGEAELDSGDPEAAQKTLEEALALWRGPVLSDVALLGFARREAERLDELRLAAREARLEAELILGRHHELVPELTQLVRAEPYRERPHAQLMLALYRSGRQAEALETYARLRRTLRAELGLEPTPRLQELQQAILRHDTSLAPVPRRRRGTLPVPANRLIGRVRELAALQRLLQRDDVRLVTLTGAGGSGKTRLALEAAAQLSDEFDGGAFFADLAPLADPALVLPALADSIDLRHRGAEPLVETLSRHLADKRALIMLDNFEHLLMAAADVAALLRTAPQLKLLITSRTALRLSGEWELSLAPLDEPDAVALFAARAQAASVDFEPDHTVAAICRRIDNLPLAIELAAPQIRIIAPSELLDRLENRLPNLTHGPSDVPGRQQTVRATIDWSHGLLGVEAQDLFARLSVFAAGFTLRAASTVADATFDGIAALVDQSLVQRGGDRFSMLETIREYAAERLADADPSGEIRDRHADYFLDIAEQAAPALPGATRARWLAQLEADHDNLRAALSCTLDRNHASALRIAVALAPFWRGCGYLSEGRSWLETALNLRFADEPALRARALEAASDLAGSQGDFEHASRLARESAATFRSLDDDDGLARGLRLEGWWAACMRDNNGARRLLQQSHALAPDEGLTLERLGAVALNVRRYTEAKSFFEQGLTAFHAHGDEVGATGPRVGLGLVALAQQRIDHAAQHFRRALLELQELGDSGWGISYCLEGLAAVEAAQMQPRRAASLLAKAEALRDDILHPLDPFEQEVHAHTLQCVHDRLDEASRAQASTLGKALSLQDAISFALHSDCDHHYQAGDGDRRSGVE